MLVTNIHFPIRYNMCELFDWLQRSMIGKYHLNDGELILHLYNEVQAFNETFETTFRPSEVVVSFILMKVRQKFPISEEL